MSFRNTGDQNDDDEAVDHSYRGGHRGIHNNGRYVYGQQTQMLYHNQQQRNTDLQRECLDSLRTSLAMTAETEEVSRVTAEKLNEQTETLHRIRDTTETIGANLDTSQYLLNGMKSWWGSVWQIFTKPPSAANNVAAAKAKARTQAPPAISETPHCQRTTAPTGAQSSRLSVGESGQGENSSVVAGSKNDEFEETLNRDLSTITNMLSTIHGRAVEMNSTIGYQTGLIDEVGQNVESNTARMKDQRKQMNTIAGRKN